MLNAIQIERAKAAAAKTDMGRARRHGILAIAQTAKGTVELQYTSGKYTLNRLATYKQEGGLLAQGPAPAVFKVLKDLYVVV